jgi:RNA polymerase sigma factor (sigma-70 family)
MTDKELAERSKHWAAQFAKRLSLAWHIVDELAQEAALGILRARQLYQPKLGAFDSYAQSWAFALMRRHVNKLAGPVNHSEAMPHAVSLVMPTDTPGPGHVDYRTTPAQTADVEFAEAIDAQEPTVQVMIEAKIKGASNDEIADGMGLSREYVRKKLRAFAESLEGA